MGWVENRAKAWLYVALNRHEPETYLDSIIYLPHGGRIDGSQALHEPQTVHGADLVQNHGGRFVEAGLAARFEGNFPRIGGSRNWELMAATIVIGLCWFETSFWMMTAGRVF